MIDELNVRNYCSQKLIELQSLEILNFWNNQRFYNELQNHYTNNKRSD